MSTITIAKPCGFSLAAASEFYRGFVPGSGMAAEADDALTLAFRLDRTFDAVVVALRETGGSLVGDVRGTGDSAAVARQVSRILGLDADAASWLAVGRRDPVVGRLQATFPGFFTATKPSPYDAAAWGVLSTRMSIQAAAKLKMRIAREYGDTVPLNGHTHHVFPSPRRILEIDGLTGVPDEKLARLKGVAAAALDGRLDAERLRSTSAARALAELQTLRGVGPWIASHIYYRGAAPHDGLPGAEPRVLHGFAHAYGRGLPSSAEFVEVAEAWRPFRMWVCVLLSRYLGLVGAWRTPGLARERAEAGRRVSKEVARVVRPQAATR